MKTVLPLLALGVVLVTPGCTTTPAGLPAGSRIVGGGLEISWTAPKPGIVVLREETTKKIVSTQTLGDGDEFRFPSGDTSTGVLTTLFGETTATNLNFVLYFAPMEGVKK